MSCANFAPVDIQRPGPERFVVGGDRAPERLAGHDDGLPARLQRGAAPRAIVGLGETLAVKPAQRVPNLPARIFNGDGEPVKCTRPAEREQVRAGLGDAQRLRPERDAGYGMVPARAEERKAVGRIGDNRVHTPIGHGTQQVQAVTLPNLPVKHPPPPLWSQLGATACRVVCRRRSADAHRRSSATAARPLACAPSPTYPPHTGGRW